jgi:hypothetical protein
MKKTTKKTKPNIRVIKHLAEQFSVELDKKLPITVLPNGGILYKDYLVKEMKSGNWGVYNYKQNSLVEQFYLKTCALMAAKAHASTNLSVFIEVKQLDNRYWANHCDFVVYKNNIKTAKDFDRYLVLLTKLEESQLKEAYYKEAISNKFKWSFV